MRTAYFSALVVLAFGSACRSKSAPAPAPSARASAAASAAVTPSARCREISTGPSLTVGEGGETAGREPEEEEDERELPFATSLGSGFALPGWFAGAGLRTRGGGSEAFIALVPASGAPGAVVSLERVHGDVDAPLVAGRGGELVALVPDSDAGGGMLRVARIELATKRVTNGAQITGVDHDAGAALGVSDQGALVVWGAGRPGASSLRVARLDLEKGAALSVAADLPGTGGAEAPALVTRAGGYFLAFIAERTVPDAGARSDAGAGLEQLVDLGPRVLMAVPLDASGKPSGAARAVSGEAAHVVGFDAVALPDGALGLAWREDAATPGVEGGALELARVGLDGAPQRGRIDDEDLSAGLPTLLRDPNAGGRVWVAVRSASDASRVGLLAPNALGVESLTGDRLLRGAEVLAAGDGKLLVGRSRGRSIELDVLECRP
jgi:hypothetical protein